MNLEELVVAINEKNIEKVTALISSKQFNVNSTDESGMTPLHHACFKGASEIVDYLLAMGSDVNANIHEQGYTALMFAALSGRDDIVIKLLRAGAKTGHINSVGRTASQMAAFTGSHRISTIINNYVERCDIAFFTIPNGVNKEVRLQPGLVDPVHRLVNELNFAPVNICLKVRQENLTPHWHNMAIIFEQLAKQSFSPHDTNEGMSIKYSVLAVICRRIGEAYKAGDTSLDNLIKKLLVGVAPFGYPEGQEKLLRQSLREFPYAESQLYRMIITQLHTVKVGHAPTTLNSLLTRINGQVYFQDPVCPKECATCNNLDDANKKCARCMQVSYCNVECQRMHWFTHKKFCGALKKMKENMKETTNPSGDHCGELPEVPFKEEVEIRGDEDDIELSKATDEKLKIKEEKEDKEL